jgi:hypothetical protein
MILDTRDRRTGDVFFSNGDQMTPNEGARAVPAQFIPCPRAGPSGTVGSRPLGAKGIVEAYDAGKGADGLAERT